MEVASLAFTVAQTLLTSLQSPEIRALFSTPDYRSQLEILEGTIETIKCVLLSADSKQEQGLELSPQQWNFIDNLKDGVYEADDLIDECMTVVFQRQQQNPGKVHDLFSRVKNLIFATEVSQKVKNIREKLDRIGDDANKFCFKINDQPIRKRREETCSYVNKNDIVGRNGDKKKIVDILLDPNSSQEEDVSVLSIVGIGGLGKTALAQCIYNDPKINEHFPLRLWVCVSDQDQNQFEVKPILAKILKSTDKRQIDDLSFDQLVQQLHKKLDQNKFLLVLDDVWTENHNDWSKLGQYLLGVSHKGNKIVVTTRSEGTATTIGSSHTHKLKGLSDDHSWGLFEMVVGDELANRHDLLGIGKEIVKKCANVPLAIKTIGSLLYGQKDEKMWQSFQNSRLMEIRKDQNDIMPILKFSYYHLSSSLKSCFTYCALFPKDFVYDKKRLLHLWMAQDYVKPLDEGQNIEDAAEEYFQILSRRCFFQDIENIYQGSFLIKNVKFKIHDLMHDMAQQVAGKEISIANSTTSTLNNSTTTPDKKVRHLYGNALCCPTQGLMVRTKIRTYVVKFDYGVSQFPVHALLANWRSLRTLDLQNVGLSSLPNTIGQLLHLRYLDLSRNEKLKKLPKSLTKLINLQFLSLSGCDELKELPEGFRKLVNLKTLYLAISLESTPLDMAKMTRLTTLNFIIVSQRKLCPKLEELRALRNLKGSLSIYLHGNNKRAKDHCGEEGYISNTEHLSSIGIEWRTNLKCSSDEENEGRLGNDEEVLEDLQPHTNLKDLKIKSYPGVRMPGWARQNSLTTSLPNLVQIELYNCDGLKELPWLGRLQHLTYLILSDLKNVEYMENRRSIGDDGAVSSRAVESSTILFFPSLAYLSLHRMPKLKGWWKEMSNSKSEIVNSDYNMLTTPIHPLLSFPCLSYLEIHTCDNMTSIPQCPAINAMILNPMLNHEFREELEERYGYASITANNIKTLSGANLLNYPAPPCRCEEDQSELCSIS